MIFHQWEMPYTTKNIHWNKSVQNLRLPKSLKLSPIKSDIKNMLFNWKQFKSWVKSTPGFNPGNLSSPSQHTMTELHRQLLTRFMVICVYWEKATSMNNIIANFPVGYAAVSSIYKRIKRPVVRLSEAMTSNDVAGQLISENWWCHSRPIKVLYFWSLEWNF